jgi:hypothetical protein
MQGTLRILRHLAIVALFARALLPAGWMPDTQAGMVICSATLGMVHHDTAPGHHDQHQTQNEECPFAAASVMAAAPDAPHIALPAAHAFAASVDRARAAVIAARFTPNSPRAPPLNA